MNTQEKDILSTIYKEPFVNQRVLSESCGHSLGVVNRSIKNLMSFGYLDDSFRLTPKAQKLFCSIAPRRAVILAAGFGMRMAPINLETPKALIEVNGEILIERTIEQLHEVGIFEIYVIVGFMKEAFDYLVDKYGVKLIINDLYASRNNLHSLMLAEKYLENAYVIPCDIWCDRNPFRKNELYSWYMVSDLIDDESSVRVNRKMQLVSIPERSGGNGMIGIAYLSGDEADRVRQNLKNLDQDSRFDNCFWERSLFVEDKMMVQARVEHSTDFVEINTYEQLRDLDEDSNHLKTDAIDVISKVFKVSPKEICDINVLKKGMTNRSFQFSCKQKKYIMRIPGEGTDALINRQEEASVYNVVSGRGICDDVVYINPQNGYKITEFLNDVRVCDANCEADLIACMKKLREFHNLKLIVSHEFDLFGQINFYEKLRNGSPSIFKDYDSTKKNVFSLRSFIDSCVTEKILTHIDAVPDNFLFSKNSFGETIVSLIDWEYAGMQDPHVDLAMFSVYSFYDKEQVDNLLNIYFEGACSDKNRIKVYAYMAVCGFLWSNWCEYKSSLGVEFGEYHLRQYRYAKDFYKLVCTERAILNI